LFVLMNAGLRQAAITTYGRARHSDNVVRDVTVAPVLKAKLQCFAGSVERVQQNAMKRMVMVCG
jgi:hypothetical protein